MSRRPVSERAAEVAEQAVELLIARGYADFRMSELAQARGVSEAALYRYVESKDALVHLAFAAALSPGAAFKPPAVPVPTPARRATVRMIERFLERRSPLHVLRAQLGRRPAPADPQAELEAITGALFDALAAYRRAIRLIERIAPEWPELHASWYGGTRARFFHELTQFLARRMRQGALAAHDPATAATLLVETVHYFAVVRYYETQAAQLDPAEVRRTVVGVLGAGFRA